MAAGGLPLWTSFSHSGLPVLKSKHSTSQRCSSVGSLPSRFSMYNPFLGAATFSSLTTVVRKIRLPATTGEDQPRLGISVDQTTFLVVSQLSGSVFASATPAFAPPRKEGQSSARAGTA